MDGFRKDHQDDEVIELLGKLNQAGPEYPPHLFAARRAAMLGALVVLPLGGVVAASWLARLVKMVKAMGMIDKIILAAEVVAVTGLTTYGAVTAYVYRHEIKQLLFPAPTLSTTNPIPSLDANFPVAETEAVPSDTPVGTASPTLVGTVTPLSPLGATSVPPLNMTPVPAGGGAATPDHGLHLGQTKTPDESGKTKVPKGP